MEFQIIFYSEKFLYFCAYVCVYAQEEYCNFIWQICLLAGLV